MYLVIVFDTTSTQENPVKPVEKVAKTVKELCLFISQNVDDTHYCMVRSLDVI